MEELLKKLNNLGLIKELGMPEGYFLKAKYIKKDHFFGMGCVEDVIVFSKHFKHKKTNIDFPDFHDVVRSKDQIFCFIENKLNNL